MRVALYARYSSDNQRDASIEDQLRLCRLHAEQQGWTVVDSFTDRAISGASLLRPGIQELMQDALKGKFDIILAEAMDRLSRDQEDIAGLYKRMTFASVRIVTLSEGEVSHLHIGLKGTMNALFLKDLADKTRRGLRGRVEQGKSGGGLCFGYDVVKAITTEGELLRGSRTINTGEAAIVRQIFLAYNTGKSPRAIARELNRQHLPGPEGSEWGHSTIRGNPARGTGILNNELYIGRLVWNRLRYIKDPDSGKRVSRPNPETAWVIHEVPELRIIDQELWELTKIRLKATSLGPLDPKKGNRKNDRRRPKHLLAGLVKCGVCGGGYTLISKYMLGCANVRNKATCDNRLNIRLDQLESLVLNGLRDNLMKPQEFGAFCKEFARQVNQVRIAQRSQQAEWPVQLVKVERQIKDIITAIKDGMYQPSMKVEMSALEAKKKYLTEHIANAGAPPPLLHPAMAADYQKKLQDLYEALQHEDRKAGAAEVLRTLIRQVTLTPENGKLVIYLSGELAKMLALMANCKSSEMAEATRFFQPPPGSAASMGSSSQEWVVAGVGFEPTTFRL